MRFVTPSGALQTIIISRAQMWNHFSLLSFLLVGRPESHPEEHITANTLTAHLFSGLLRYASLSAKSRKRNPGKPQLCLHCSTKITPSYETPRKHPILSLHAESNQTAPPHAGKDARRAKKGSYQHRGYLLDVSRSWIYVISRRFRVYVYRQQTHDVNLQSSLEQKTGLRT